MIRNVNLLAYSVIAKYVDALPLYRQERAFKRLGIDLPRNTLAHWMIQASEGSSLRSVVNTVSNWEVQDRR